MLWEQAEVQSTSGRTRLATNGTGAELRVILLQKKSIESMEDGKAGRLRQADVTKIPNGLGQGLKKCRDLLKRAEKFQTKEAKLPHGVLSKHFGRNGRSFTRNET